jgi:hypothetical protein
MQILPEGQSNRCIWTATEELKIKDYKLRIKDESL